MPMLVSTYHVLISVKTWNQHSKLQALAGLCLQEVDAGHLAKHRNDCRTMRRVTAQIHTCLCSTCLLCAGCSKGCLVYSCCVPARLEEAFKQHPFTHQHHQTSKNNAFHDDTTSQHMPVPGNHTVNLPSRCAEQANRAVLQNQTKQGAVFRCGIHYKRRQYRQTCTTQRAQHADSCMLALDPALPALYPTDCPCACTSRPLPRLSKLPLRGVMSTLRSRLLCCTAPGIKLHRALQYGSHPIQPSPDAASHNPALTLLRTKGMHRISQAEARPLNKLCLPACVKPWVTVHEWAHMLATG